MSKPAAGTPLDGSNPLVVDTLLLLGMLEGSGSVTADSVPGTPYSLNSPTWSTGPDGAALLFGGSDYVETRNLATGANFSIAAWVRKDATGQMAIAAQVDSSFASGFYLRTGHSGFTVGGTYKEVAVPDPPVGEWHHLALTYDGSMLTSYYDAVSYDSFPWTGTPDNPGTTLFTIGRPGGFSGQYWTGRIELVQVSTRAWSSTEVSDHYANAWAQYAGSPPGTPASPAAIMMSF